MATINIRRLDDEVVRKLKVRAVENNRSLEGEVRFILERAVQDDTAAKLRAFRERSRRLRELTAGAVQTPSEILIREERNRRGYGYP